MLYPKNLEEKLGFDKIRQLLKERCNGTLGQDFVEKIRFTDRADIIKRLISQTNEFKQILEQDESFPNNNFIDISESLSKAEIQGTFLTEEEFYQLQGVFRTLDLCLAFFQEKEAEEFPELYLITSRVEFNRGVLQAIEDVIDDRGKVKSNASPELGKIRQQIQSEQSSLRRKMDQVIARLKSQGFAKEDAAPTIRDGRMVVPVISTYKRHVKGFIHDSSSTGLTLFIEPEELLNVNNEIKDLELKEKQEIVKILTKLTDFIRPDLPVLGKANQFLGIIDFIRAKARLALELECDKADFEEKALIEWYNVYHPLLYFSHKQQNKPVIPQKIKLEEDQRIMLISGPNAGGKSVTLKTVGLVQYMFQCGLLVPVAEGSKMGIFKNILMDFGDEQSLEDDLSTYSSHLTNMKAFLRHANAKTLCLIDEFGSGTEPELGGAIAESILEQLNRQQVFGVITTHYANLKFYADRTEGVFNGAMRYDVEHIRPLYKLDMGKPGSSFALEIAENIGLPKKIVNNARHKVGKKKVNVEKLLNDLELEKKQLEDKQAELKQKDRQLKETLEKYDKLKTELDTNKKKLLNEAKKEAAQILQTANQRIESTIKAIRENKADKEATKQLRSDLEEFKSTVQPVESEPEKVPQKPEIKILGGWAEVGDYVQIIGQETVGEVMEINKKDAVIRVGDLRTKIKLKRLLRISKKEYIRTLKEKEANEFVKVSIGNTASSNVNQKIQNFTPNIDIRGKRAEEIFPILNDFMDDAIMLNQKSLTILHGKGDGILRDLVRQHLRSIKEVKSMKDEHADRGGAGVTLVELKA